MIFRYNIPDPGHAVSMKFHLDLKENSSTLPGKNTNRLRTSDHQEISILFHLQKPQIILYDNVISDAECDELIRLAHPRIEKSLSANLISGESELHSHRTSSGMFFLRGETPLISRIEKRLSELTGSPLQNGEGLQVLHYAPGQQYKPHYDYFPLDQPGSHRFVENGGQRVATFILYLNNVEEGGDTAFPEIHMNIKPVKGSGLYFAYTDDNDVSDPLTLHAGCPVTLGEKWIATKWMRKSVFREVYTDSIPEPE